MFIASFLTFVASLPVSTSLPAPGPLLQRTLDPGPTSVSPFGATSHGPASKPFAQDSFLRGDALARASSSPACACLPAGRSLVAPVGSVTPPTGFVRGSAISYTDVAAYEASLGVSNERSGFQDAVSVAISNPIMIDLENDL